MGKNIKTLLQQVVKLVLPVCRRCCARSAVLSQQVCFGSSRSCTVSHVWPTQMEIGATRQKDVNSDHHKLSSSQNKMWTGQQMPPAVRSALIQ